MGMGGQGGRTVLAIGALRSSLISAGHSESLVLFLDFGIAELGR